MRINRVVLENYGLYCGRTEIDLVPQGKSQQPRPIILIGGMNGAGKTTLLDAVKLALYGRTAVGERIGEKKYHEHLRGLVHRSRNSLVQFDYARVGVEFDFVLKGNRETYYVQRCWTLRGGNGVEETLQVYRRDAGATDGDYNTWPTLPDMEPEHWQAFVSDVVPERLSQLFFFDGEKIKRIADDISGDNAIAEATRSLLGLDVVGRLKADLGLMAVRVAKEHQKDEERGALAAVEAQIEVIRAAMQSEREKRETLVTTVHGVEGDIRRLERQLQEQGGGFAADRPAKLEQQKALEVELQALKRQVRLECEGLFPLALCRGVAQVLESEIEHEAQSRRLAMVRDEIEGLQGALVRSLSKASAMGGGEARKEAVRIVQETVAAHLDQAKLVGNGKEFIGLSEAEAGRVLVWLRDAQNGVSATMRRLGREIEEREREAQKIHHQLEQAPEEPVLAPVFSELNGKHQELGQCQGELKMLDERIAALENQLAAKDREQKRLLDRGHEAAKAQGRVKLIGDCQRALDLYLARLTAMKVESLCKTVTECFNRLSRKGDLLHNISINPETFEVLLQDKSGYRIPRDELSAGEKQILAISILWGLGKTAGRPLPVIIDTPLGRLDSDHRMNLVRNYFPHAGHQVVLLSTDTEVDKPLFDELRPYVSHCYHLLYDKEERRTVARREYFWKEQAHA